MLSQIGSEWDLGLNRFGSQENPITLYAINNLSKPCEIQLADIHMKQKKQVAKL
jgi:hypothetical protein